jgi:hypothetical protein
MTKERRVYHPRIVGGKVMMPADLVRAEFKALVEQCRTALRNRADEND